MISKEFTAYGRRPSISDTCIFIHFNQRFLKTQGNSSVPLKITSFPSCFPYCFFFLEKEHILQSQSVFMYFTFTFIFKQIIFKGFKKRNYIY